MSPHQNFTELLALVQKERSIDLDRFLTLSDVCMGSPARAEERLLESLALACAFRMTAN
jgi:hypothetical protein